MKNSLKVISLVLLLSVFALALVGCGGKDESDPLIGYYTKDDIGYFFTGSDTVVVSSEGTFVVSHADDGNGNHTVGNIPTFSESELTPGEYSAPKVMEAYYIIDNYKITGLTELGKTVKVLPIPDYVTDIKTGAFIGGCAEAVVIGKGSVDLTLANGAFKETENLKVIVAGGVTTEDLFCGGAEVAEGAKNIEFLFPQSEYANFKTHYAWGEVADFISKY